MRESASRRGAGESGDFVGVGVGVGTVVAGIRVVTWVIAGIFSGVVVGAGVVTWNVTTPIYPFASVKLTS